MSRIVPTSMGRFRQVTDGIRNWFLWECPTCLEWLPMTEDTLNGEVSIDHCDRNGFLCLYRVQPDTKLGAILVSTMQARILCEQNPYTEDDE